MATLQYIARHAETLANRPKKELMRGHSRSPLDPEGRDEAKKMGQFLKSKGITKIYSSDLPRVAETARIIARELGGIPVELRKDMRTWDPGVMTGRPVKDVQGAVDYFEQHPDIAPPGGEKVGAFHDRMVDLWEEIKKCAKDNEGPYLWLVHTRPILTMMALSEGKDAIAMHGKWDEAPEPASVMCMKLNPSGKTSIKQLLGKTEEDATKRS